MGTTLLITDALNVIGSFALQKLLLIPGMPTIMAYIQSSYQNDPFRVGLEALLVFFTIKYLWSAPKTTKFELSEKEIDGLVEEWEPEPLVDPRVVAHPVKEIGTVVKTASGQELINMAAPNYLGLANTERSKKTAIDTVRVYGVGTCGPAGFYGTLDIHLKLEKELARVLGTEAAIIYAQGFAAVSSVIPAFSKRGDILVVDEQANMAIQKGAQISRSRVYFFKHNDMEDLERVLDEINAADAKKNTPLTRRFIVAEGLYAKTGQIAPIRNLIEIKNRFKYRLILDESISLGALGERGLGAADHFQLPNDEIDIIVGNLSGALGAAGGFCAGSEAIVDHQRLSSQAYCFSASLPALLAKCALENLLEIEAHPEHAIKLASNVRTFRDLMSKELNDSGFELKGHRRSPLMLLQLARPQANEARESALIQNIIDSCQRKGVLVTQTASIKGEEHIPMRPSVKIVVSAAHTASQLEAVAKAISMSIRESKLLNL